MKERLPKSSAKVEGLLSTKYPFPFGKGNSVTKEFFKVLCTEGPQSRFLASLFQKSAVLRTEDRYCTHKLALFPSLFWVPSVPSVRSVLSVPSVPSLPSTAKPGCASIAGRDRQRALTPENKILII